MTDQNNSVAPVKSPTTPYDNFHIGITMAGAASAGCYTAGVMDYMFEILNLWENAKKGKYPAGWENIPKLAPPHSVTIDAMGGTSAGGMTTVMAAIYALKGEINPVNKTDNKGEKKGNILYDSWVLMGDGVEKGQPEKKKDLLFERTLDTSDLAAGKIQSLLNSEFIDNICNDAFTHAPAINKRPSYISENLELVLSHTMLRPLPLAIEFTTPIAKARKNKKSPEHNTFDHFTMSHFKLGYDPEKPIGTYLPLTPHGNNKYAELLKLATKATGAFPIGLRFREFFNNELTKNYIQETAEKIIFDRPANSIPSDKNDIKWPGTFPDPFSFVSVDGGAVNNEPFGEVLRILKERHGTKQSTDDYKYGLIMIDPFPDVVSKEKYKQPDDLFSVAPAIIGALWDQAKVKRAEMVDAYSSDYYRGEIFPVRYIHDTVKHTFTEEKENKIACGAAMAFSGFFDIDFRQHDFFLGRDNARNFFRAFFTLEFKKDWDEPDNPSNIVHPIHANWTKEMENYFKKPGDEEKGTFFLPIIPDLYFLKEQIEKTYEGPYQHTVEEWPQYDPEKLFALEDKMNARVIKMLELAYKKTKTKDEVKEEDKKPVTDEWISNNFRSNLIKKFTGWVGGGVLKVIFNISKGKIASRITKAAFVWILKDLEAKGLLKRK
jgi:hypothetical protein